MKTRQYTKNGIYLGIRNPNGVFLRKHCRAVFASDWFLEQNVFKEADRK